MSYIQNLSILPLRTLTSPSRLLTGGAIVIAGLAFAANNLLIIA